MAVPLALLAGGCGGERQGTPPEKRLVILGFDGVDPGMLRRWMDEGKLPHLKALADRGDFRPLRSTNPPQSPAECVFARTTRCVSADLTTPITPCQYGGKPDCTNCGCIASAGLAAVARHSVMGVIPVGWLVEGSMWVGAAVRKARLNGVGGHL